MLLKDKVALVTGAGSGIGREVALAFAREGACVVVADVDATGGEETVARIHAGADGGGSSPGALFVRMDVSDPADHEAAVASAVQRFGALHVACNNAGIARGSPEAAVPLAQISARDWQRVIDVNLSGTFHGLRTQIPALLAAGGGAIVNVASVLGQVGNLSLSPYVASKHGIVGLTRAAALDYAQQGVRVNAVGPGYIDTPILSAASAEARARMVAQHPMGRLGGAGEIAELVLWLCSERASFCTGGYYPADGGFLAR
ncbi:SDR family NAD(P)-dependent oxidoreductase [Hydrogenophaga palleronii]|uniref:SDR family NAD(P)-dependent oxidoreductase n=1 Tax=Hydrogenophaga palleronii TaxID=65655 RepID=UPI000A83382E|nr:SDR family oxidoreductase [Hydrogenophaga palleronii]